MRISIFTLLCFAACSQAFAQNCVEDAKQRAAFIGKIDAAELTLISGKKSLRKGEAGTFRFKDHDGNENFEASCGPSTDGAAACECN